MKQDRKPSIKWTTVQEVADHFCVSQSTVLQGIGAFASLRRAKLGKRTLILRADVDKLNRELERKAEPKVA